MIIVYDQSIKFVNDWSMWHAGFDSSSKRSRRLEKVKSRCDWFYYVTFLIKLYIGNICMKKADHKKFSEHIETKSARVC